MELYKKMGKYPSPSSPQPSWSTFGRTGKIKNKYFKKIVYQEIKFLILIFLQPDCVNL